MLCSHSTSGMLSHSGVCVAVDLAKPFGQWMDVTEQTRQACAIQYPQSQQACPQIGDIYIDVHTTIGGTQYETPQFTSTPQYVASFGGISEHHLTTGASSIFSATPSGLCLELVPLPFSSQPFSTAAHSACLVRRRLPCLPQARAVQHSRAASEQHALQRAIRPAARLPHHLDGEHRPVPRRRRDHTVPMDGVQLGRESPERDLY